MFGCFEHGFGLPEVVHGTGFRRPIADKDIQTPWPGRGRNRAIGHDIVINNLTSKRIAIRVPEVFQRAYSISISGYHKDIQASRSLAHCPGTADTPFSWNKDRKRFNLEGTIILLPDMIELTPMATRVKKEEIKASWSPTYHRRGVV